MQPLSYQVLSTSCWVTSMLNGILFLYKDKHVPFIVYKLLNNLLTDKGVLYYTKQHEVEFDAIINAVSACTEIEISFERGDSVEDVIRGLDYKAQVAVCDINAGDHSILINGFQNDIFDTFDPYWDNVKGERSIEFRYKAFAPYMPGSKNSVNLQIWAEHLFEKRVGKGFQMGAVPMRGATVLTRKNLRNK